MAINSLEKVINFFLDMAEQKTEEAQKMSIEKVEEIDDLDQGDNPERCVGNSWMSVHLVRVVGGVVPLELWTHRVQSGQFGTVNSIAIFQPSAVRGVRRCDPGPYGPHRAGAVVALPLGLVQELSRAAQKQLAGEISLPSLLRVVFATCEDSKQG